MISTFTARHIYIKTITTIRHELVTYTCYGVQDLEIEAMQILIVMKR
jgi:hypothetical protein